MKTFLNWTPMLSSLARFCVRHKRIVVFVIWIPLAIAMVFASSSIGTEFNTEMSMPSSESSQAESVLAGANPNQGGESSQLVFRTTSSIDDPQIKKIISDAIAAVDAINNVDITSPFVLQNQISKNRKIAFSEVNVPRRNIEEYKTLSEEIKVATAPARAAGIEIGYGGAIFQEVQLPESEALGVLAAILILVLAFGSVIAMGLPISIALIGLIIATSIVGIISHFIAVPDAVTSMVGMIGLGVGIDYALFIVTRFREGLHDGLSVEEAVVESIDTSGRAVVFAGITVIVAALGLLTIGLSFVTGLAIGMATAVAVMVIASITLLPALLAMVGERIDTTSRAAVISLIAFVLSGFIAVFTKNLMILSIGVGLAVASQLTRFIIPALRVAIPHRPQNDHQNTIWWRWSRVVQRRPWISFVASSLFLIVLTVPMLSIRLGFGDAGNAPKTADVRKAYDMLSEGFGPGFSGPLYIVVTGDAVKESAKLESFLTVINKTPGIAYAGVAPMKSDEVALVMAYPTSAPQDEATTDLVHALRDTVIPSTGVAAQVTGFTAASVDFSDYLAKRLPFLIGIVLLLSFLLLMAVFRSVLVPIKAVLMNLLSVGAAYGVIVAVFQWGWGAELIGVGKPGPIEAWAPMFLFAIVFGLSMDYEVFLLSRIKEEFNRTGDNTSAVADGVAATARVITAAALIMVCVFGAFVLGDDRQLKLFGLGMAVAVFFDATIVRMVLVPATMELLGARNWWMPAWLDRLLPKIDVEGKHHTKPAPIP
jgi:RND superfamily putative drug exporter